MKNNKKVFSEEFKRNAVNLSTNNEKSLGEIADDLGIGLSTISRWRSNYPQNGTSQSEVPRKSRNPDILKLKKENERLKMEIEILKKATAFFVKENY